MSSTWVGVGVGAGLGLGLGLGPGLGLGLRARVSDVLDHVLGLGQGAPVRLGSDLLVQLRLRLLDAHLERRQLGGALRQGNGRAPLRR